MKVYPHLFAKLFGSPVMLLATTRAALERELLGRMGIDYRGPRAIHEDTDLEEPDDDDAQRQAGNWRIERITDRIGPVMVIHLCGVIDKHLSDGEIDCYGGLDLADVDAALSMCADDPSIETVLLYVNSPGGSCIGVPETAARVAALRESKQLVAYVDGVCASAAYYIASQADMITGTQSAVFGSIGVYLALLDETRALEMQGYKVELIKAGKYKAMGASFKELTDDERAILQSNVADIYAEFTTAVKELRPGVSDETMQGQCFRGPKAFAAGLCDEITTLSLDEYAASLIAG